MKLRQTLALLATLLVLVSCSSTKTTLPYFKDIQSSESGEFPAGEFEIKIVPNDELIINVTSQQPEAAAPYNIPLQRTINQDFLSTSKAAGQIQSANMQSTLVYQTYVVNREGFIDFPVLGKIHVAGMTLEGLVDYLKERISADVIDPNVRVQLANFRVNVLGEVRQPGAKVVTRERYTVLDALADAMDMTEYGERSNVLVIREENGKRVYHRLDLNDSSVLESPYFYLQQNDVVYVQPNAIRQANSKYNQDKAFKLSMTSVIVSAASVIASLVIALAIRN